MARTKAFDAAQYLDSQEAIAEYITEALQTHDADLIAKAIGNAARARGMSAIAKDSGLNRENLYRSLSANAKPEFGTIMKVLDAMDIELTARAKVA